MPVKLYDSELKIMDILWKGGEMSAREVASRLSQEVGWSKTTTYTVLKKCIEKGAVARQDPGYNCRARISKEQASAFETAELIERMYDGQPDQLVASLLGSGRLSSEQLARLKKLIDQIE